MLDVAVERTAHELLVRAAVQRGAIAAVEEVGVAAVAVVDLHEELAAARLVDVVELGAAPFGAAQREVGHVDARVSEHLRRSRPVRAAGSGLRRRRGSPRPRRTRRPLRARAGHPGGSGDRDDEHERHDGPVARTSTRTREPGLADHRRCRRPGDVRERREARRGDPRRRAHGVLQPAREVEVQVDEDERDHASRGSGDDEREPAPSPLPDQQRDDHGRYEEGTDLSERECELSDRVRDRGRGPAEIRGHALARLLAETEQQHEQDRGHTPHHESHDVARMAEVPIARGTSCRERVARQGDSDGCRSRGRSHVVPSRATAATTRRSSTMPASSPP